ncbi:MAG TPA: hypothetical protein VGM48_18815 [Puia sp.]
MPGLQRAGYQSIFTPGGTDYCSVPNSFCIECGPAVAVRPFWVLATEGRRFAFVTLYYNKQLSLPQTFIMVKFALLARLEAKAGKEKELADFLKSALPLAEAETGTVHWFALQIGPSTFGIFDTFETEEGRKAHLAGQIAAALMAKAPELLATQPVIEQVDLLAVK